MTSTADPKDVDVATSDLKKPQHKQSGAMKYVLIAGIVGAIVGIGAIVAAVVVVSSSSAASPPPTAVPVVASPPPVINLPPATAAPPGQAQIFKATTSFVASGTVAEYTTNKTTAIKTVVATEAGVRVDQVAISVEVATRRRLSSSVTVTVVISFEAAENADTGVKALTAPGGMFASASALSSALVAGGVTGIDVSSITPPVVEAIFTLIGATGLPLKGTYITNYQEYITIDDGYWISVSSSGASMYRIEAFANNWIILQNSANNSYNPNLWSKIEWHAHGAGYGFCQSVYNGATAASTYNTDTSSVYNGSNAGSGCNGWGHTTMTKYDAPMKGTWLTNFGSYITVSNTAWYSISSSGSASIYAMEAYTNKKMLMQNAATNAWNPLKYTLAEYHATANGYGYCQSVYAGATAASTLLTDTSAIYNGSNAGSGCNGWGHTTMTKYDAPMKGTWLTNFGSYITVSNTAWYSVSSSGSASVYAMEAYTNKKMLMQNAATNAWNPLKYTLAEYHATANGYGFCQSVYAGATADSSLLTDTSAIYNGSNAGSGCNGWGHTTMTAYSLPIIGAYTTNWGANLTISSSEWRSGTSTYRIEAYGSDWILAQNAADASWNPNLWSKFVWHTVGSGFGFCQIVYNGVSPEATLAADISATHNASDSAAGCNGFSFTIAS